jgi:hypothetical protein
MTKLAVLSLALMACGGGSNEDSSEFEAAAASMEGIYQVQSYTRNDSACSPGGESILGGDGFAAAYTQKFLGITLLSVISCDSPQDCRDKLAAEQRGEGFQIDFLFSVELLGNDGELIGSSASTGFGDGSVCTDAELGDTVLTLAGSELRLEQAITIADDFPVDGDGFCTTVAASEAAEGKSCSEMEVLTATFFEPL